MKLTKHFLPMLAAFITAVSCTHAQKVLVVYYSQTGNTRAIAQELQKKLGADIVEIQAETPYDGDFKATIERSSQEREAGILPQIKPVKADLSQYDIIFVGYPIWFGTYAPPIASWLEQVNLSGKTVVPFCTFGSGGLQSSAADLVQKQPGAQVKPGYGVRAARMDAMPAELDQFLKANAYLEGEYVQLDDFSAENPVTEEEAAIFDAAVAGYPMIHARAIKVASRSIPGGREYLFTAENIPTEGMPQFGPKEMKVYVTKPDGIEPYFTQVVR